MEEKANVEIKKTIDSLEFLIDEDCSDTQFDYIEEIESAIKALTELQQYHAIGTLEECRTAREKQMPKKPYHISQVDDNDNANVECPVCHATADYAVNVIKRGHCWKCGQLLDWSDEK